jgi:hypothetical protein
MELQNHLHHQSNPNRYHQNEDKKNTMKNHHAKNHALMMEKSTIENMMDIDIDNDRLHHLHRVASMIIIEEEINHHSWADLNHVHRHHHHLLHQENEEDHHHRLHLHHQDIVVERHQDIVQDLHSWEDQENESHLHHLHLHQDIERELLLDHHIIDILDIPQREEEAQIATREVQVQNQEEEIDKDFTGL